MDLNLLVWIHQHLVVAQLNDFFVLITNLWGNGLLAVLLTLILIIKKETRLTGLIIAASLLFDLLIVNVMLKPLIARPRPYTFYQIAMLLPEQKDFSFPSGHSSSVFAFVWAYFSTRKDLLRWLLLGFALLVSFSRLYLFVHYPSDVLAGIIIGILCAVLAKWLINKFTDKPWLINILK
ncbi:phosphatase PAP2 family protein [Acetobacterium woodii]|uniref:Putative phosphatase n=1 Tax=Acetobacterium woodii (strain ATCC 29683 / DSM 1030 / JCM 2381 / KCTC 1655 / WB1) TaxID=931626 RepID=H6LGW6_ACEWD|nr:phosphatase PAP2 family protein [Acetobacterium woodii]AFA49630.1 putative phosphatase [Acetobacterium woodii DSM 1030]